MKLWLYKALCSLLCWGLSAQLAAQDGFTVPIGSQSGLKIKAPDLGAFHSAFVDTKDNIPSGTELLERVQNFEQQSGRKLQLVTIQSNWRDGFQFPLHAVQELYESGYFAQVRIMPGLDSRVDTGKPDPIFDLKKVATGEFDGPLITMLQSIAALKGKNGRSIPVMISFAPEPNGGRYRHSGSLYGAGQTSNWGDSSFPDGPEIFRDAYRHLIDLARRSDVNALNITWALHLESEARPLESWNAMKNYYPGDAYIDWLGLSVLGTQKPQDLTDYKTFQDLLRAPSIEHESRWAEFMAISAQPFKGLFKFAAIEDPDQPCRKAAWLSQTLQSIPQQFNPFKMVNYWSESLAHDPGASLRLDTSPCAVDAYRKGMASEFFQSRLRLDGADMPRPPVIENVPPYATFYGCDQDVRSFNGPKRLYATFQGSVDFEVHWINAQGRSTFMGRGHSGRPLTLTTTSGHAFFIRVNGQCAGKVKIGLANNIFQVG